MATPSVLVIEDDRDVLQLLGSYVERLGWRVRLATTGEDGLELACAETPDVVVLDVALPGIDGAEVARSLRADPRTRSCRIVVTSVLDPEQTAVVRSDALLPKPFTRRDVLRVLGSLGLDHAGAGTA